MSLLSPGEGDPKFGVPGLQCIFGSGVQGFDKLTTQGREEML